MIVACAHVADVVPQRVEFAFEGVESRPHRTSVNGGGGRGCRVLVDERPRGGVGPASTVNAVGLRAAAAPARRLDGRGLDPAHPVVPGPDAGLETGHARLQRARAAAVARVVGPARRRGPLDPALQVRAPRLRLGQFPARGPQLVGRRLRFRLRLRLGQAGAPFRDRQGRGQLVPSGRRLVQPAAQLGRARQIPGRRGRLGLQSRLLAARPITNTPSLPYRSPTLLPVSYCQGSDFL